MELVKDERAARHGAFPRSGRPASPIVPGSRASNLLAPLRRFDPAAPELMDCPGIDPVSLREELQALERANRDFGGHQLMLEYVRRFFFRAPGQTLSILDLGTGIADVPQAIVAWTRDRGLAATVTAVDGNPQTVEIARETLRAWPEIRVEQHDLRALPYGPGSYDLVLCSLALHHFSAADAIALLRRMQQTARVGYIVNDLRRNWAAIWTTELLARTLIKSPIVRHDAPQSCRAAFTVRELRTMAQQAGLSNFHIKRHHAVFRMVLEGRK